MPLGIKMSQTSQVMALDTQLSQTLPGDAASNKFVAYARRGCRLPQRCSRRFQG
ncbi:hypothetical protein DPMN_046267 [Dreissena polymorpha]|uniref:Uncharacterized protein n=1 Tax=Dreissena polymorpha TaxID=45954 RepID=A0A9D4I0G3_DREPO|nr:hypothetical protein DPMN_046267 [Dreissena polymorpha]